MIRSTLQPWLRAAVVAAAAIGGQSAHAGPLEDIVQKAMPYLPAYCKARIQQRDGQPQWEYWKRRLGPGFMDIHHYCYGLAEMFVARTTINEDERQGLYRMALGDFGYVIARQKPSTLAILSEVYMERGKVYVLTNDFAKAKADFDRANSIASGAYR